MKYRVKAYLCLYGSGDSEIRYKLQRRSMFGFWITMVRDTDKNKLQKQADELNLLINQ